MPPYVSAIIFLPVRPVSPGGPPITNLPVGLTKNLVLLSIQLSQIGLITVSITSSLSWLKLISGSCGVEITLVSITFGLQSSYITDTCDLPSGRIQPHSLFFLPCH